MPRKIRLPADRAQNRANQQRSRARRTAYLAGLEARVRELEARDARATLEMQRAAREVAWTNERLVELLAASGVSRARVDEFLRRCCQERRDCGAAAPGSNGGGGGGGGAMVVVAGAVDAEASQTRPAECESEGEGGDGGADMAPERRSSGDDDDVEGGGRERTLVTSCEAAASIIAGFQGHGDVSQARMALGCDGAADCLVRNTRLFQLMDETGCA
ncbi:hypothetical protein F4824DRAFT_289977 [Ustulina deusta]|nr:hypothetical protein F4824DRAFT_289977 [Ustulina deusta]